MENEKIGLKDRLLAGLPYLSGLFAIVIGAFYSNPKDRKGFVFYHCVQALALYVALTILGFVIGIIIFSQKIATREMVIGGFPEWLNWAWMLLIGILFVFAASGWKFRIPVICYFSDWFIDWIDGSKTKGKKV